MVSRLPDFKELASSELARQEALNAQQRQRLLRTEKTTVRHNAEVAETNTRLRQARSAAAGIIRTMGVEVSGVLHSLNIEPDMPANIARKSFYITQPYRQGMLWLVKDLYVVEGTQNWNNGHGWTGESNYGHRERRYLDADGTLLGARSESDASLLIADRRSHTYSFGLSHKLSDEGLVPPGTVSAEVEDPVEQVAVKMWVQDLETLVINSLR